MSDEVTEADVHYALIRAEAYCRLHLNTRTAGYALAYIKAAKRMTGEFLHAQLPYILSNLQGWRGTEAVLAKTAMRAFLKGRTRRT